MDIVFNIKGVSALSPQCNFACDKWILLFLLAVQQVHWTGANFLRFINRAHRCLNSESVGKWSSKIMSQPHWNFVTQCRADACCQRIFLAFSGCSLPRNHTALTKRHFPLNGIAAKVKTGNVVQDQAHGDKHSSTTQRSTKTLTAQRAEATLCRRKRQAAEMPYLRVFFFFPGFLWKMVYAFVFRLTKIADGVNICSWWGLLRLILAENRSTTMSTPRKAHFLRNYGKKSSAQPTNLRYFNANTNKERFSCCFYCDDAPSEKSDFFEDQRICA